MFMEDITKTLNEVTLNIYGENSEKFFDEVSAGTVKIKKAIKNMPYLMAITVICSAVDEMCNERGLDTMATFEVINNMAKMAQGKEVE